MREARSRRTYDDSRHASNAAALRRRSANLRHERPPVIALEIYRRGAGFIGASRLPCSLPLFQGIMTGSCPSGGTAPDHAIRPQTARAQRW
jgi:hypothetical protein